MLEDFTCDCLLQVCKGVQGNVKVYKEKKINYQHSEEFIVERILCILWDFTYARAVMIIYPL